MISLISISGSGIGTAFMGLCSCLSTTFDRHLAIASGIATSAIGLSTFLYPSIIRALEEEYGWRGAYVLLGAIVLQYLVVACFVKPRKCTKDEIKMRENADKVVNDGYKTLLREYLHTELLNDKRFVLLLTFLMVLHSGISIVFVHIEAFAIAMHITTDYTKWAIPAWGVSNWLGRSLFGLIGNLTRVDTTTMLVPFIALSGVAIGALPAITSGPGLIICASVNGFLSGPLGYGTIVLTVEYFSVACLPSAYGYCLLTSGVGFLLGAPAAGKYGCGISALNENS